MLVKTLIMFVRAGTAALKWWVLPSPGIDAICAVGVLSKKATVPDVHILAGIFAERSFQVCGTDWGGACVEDVRESYQTPK